MLGSLLAKRRVKNIDLPLFKKNIGNVLQAGKALFNENILFANNNDVGFQINDINSKMKAYEILMAGESGNNLDLIC